MSDVVGILNLDLVALVTTRSSPRDRQTSAASTCPNPAPPHQRALWAHRLMLEPKISPHMQPERWPRVGRYGIEEAHLQLVLEEGTTGSNGACGMIRGTFPVQRACEGICFRTREGIL